jgi:2,4-dienoyl-CoA reductase-like NADH-dependent reductase (Old Yellow Enzyme family)
MVTFVPLVETTLFKPLRIGALQLEHRVVQGPCTRMRATKESEGVYVPNDLVVESYSQRASKGGLQITEATPISRYVSTCFMGRGSQLQMNQLTDRL